MKRPSFQFYTGDWLRNAKLRRCSPAARGAWIDVLCLLHDSDEYGVLRWPLADIAHAAGLPLKLLKELVEKGVLKGADRGAEPYIYRARHAGVEGDPVELVTAGDGPCWYCSRFVRDEHVRKKRGKDTRFDADNQPPKPQPKDTPKAPPNPPIGAAFGDGASTSSSTSEDQEPHTQRAHGATFRLPLDWKPTPNHLDMYAKHAGVSLHEITPEAITEFTGFWNADGALKTDAAWCQKLVATVKNNRGKSYGQQQPARASQARAPSLDDIRRANGQPPADESGGPAGHAGRTIEGRCEQAAP